jgi:hypothetical protein
MAQQRPQRRTQQEGMQGRLQSMGILIESRPDSRILTRKARFTVDYPIIQDCIVFLRNWLEAAEPVVALSTITRRTRWI